MSELSRFKNIHDGETVLLLGTGSTLNKFKDNFGSNVKRCAVNGVIIHPEYRENLDYFIWAGDIDIPEHPQPGYNNILQASSLLGTRTQKFVNCWTDGCILHPDCNIQTQVHPDDAEKLGFIRYNQVHHKIDPNNYFHKDLEYNQNGPDGMSVAFHAMQILLFMGFKKIILVGFDCGGDHSYKNIVHDDKCDWGYNINKQLVNRWIIFSEFINKKYTNKNIYVINPIGLKGVFPELKI